MYMGGVFMFTFIVDNFTCVCVWVLGGKKQQKTIGPWT